MKRKQRHVQTAIHIPGYAQFMLLQEILHGRAISECAETLHQGCLLVVLC